MSNNLEKFEYQLLGRLQQDCDYYLGAGKRNRKHLWALDEKLQIQKMKELYENVPIKPEWLTLEAIDEYERQMVQTTKQESTMGTPNTAEKENRVVEILQHRISWFFRGDDAPTELDESSIEHIEGLIKEGYNQGELCFLDNDTEQTFRGWWHIETQAEREHHHG